MIQIGYGGRMVFFLWRWDLVCFLEDFRLRSSLLPERKKEKNEMEPPGGKFLFSCVLVGE